MATYSIANAIGFEAGSAAPSSTGVWRCYLQKVELDFAAIIADRAAAGATALAAADLIEVLHIPARSQLLAAGATVTSVESTATTGTFDVGDGDDPDGYAALLANNALASESNTTLGAKFYDAADTLDVTLGTAAPTDCVLEVWAVLADCS